jgi:OOP family OmpA-OmpF porin
MKIIYGSIVTLLLPLLVACGSLDYVFPETAQATKLTRSNAVNYAGRSAPDNDGDGVPDWADICGASTEGILVDAEGCEIVTGVVAGLEFAPDDVMLSIDAKAALDRIISAFRRNPDVILSVTSHTDNRGSAADNLALSKQRLNAVVTYMVSSGIEVQRIKPFAYGESRPISPNATLDGRERNRRIEIDVIERLL